MVVQVQEPAALPQEEEPAALLQAEGVLAVALQAAGAGLGLAQWEAVLALQAPPPAKADRPVRPLVVPETGAMQVPRPVKILRPAQIVRQFIAGSLTKGGRRDSSRRGDPNTTRFLRLGYVNVKCI